MWTSRRRITDVLLAFLAIDDRHACLLLLNTPTLHPKLALLALPPVFCLRIRHRLPLHILGPISTAASQRLHMINHPPRTRPPGLSSRRARIQPHKLSPHRPAAMLSGVRQRHQQYQAQRQSNKNIHRPNHAAKSRSPAHTFGRSISIRPIRRDSFTGSHDKLQGRWKARYLINRGLFYLLDGLLDTV